MKALSIRRPWAWLICFGIPILESVDNGDGTTRVVWNNKVHQKDIENRNWPTKYRGRIYVHAGKKEDKEALLWLMEKGFGPMMALMLHSKRIPCGAIIGEVDIVDCVTESTSPWFTGKYGFVLENPELYEKPIPCKGRLGFFSPVLGDKLEG